MKYDDLCDIWNTQQEQSLVIDEEKVLQTARAAHRREEWRIIWLNFQEGIPALGMFVFLGWSGLQRKTGAWAFLIAAILCLGVGLFLLVSTIRQRRQEASFGDSLKDQLAKSLAQVKHRQRLFQTVFWWYLLPLVVAWGLIATVLVYEMRSELELSPLLIFYFSGYVVMCFVLFWAIYRMNRDAAEKQFTPARERLEEMLAEFDSAEVLDGAD